MCVNLYCTTFCTVSILHARIAFFWPSLMELWLSAVTPEWLWTQSYGRFSVSRKSTSSQHWAKYWALLETATPWNKILARVRNISQIQWEKCTYTTQRGLGHRGGYSLPELLVSTAWAVLGDFVMFKDITVHLIHLEWCSNCKESKSYFLISHTSR